MNSSLLCKEFLAPIYRAARYAAVAPLSASRRNSASGIANSVKPQFKQTRSFGKTQTKGFSHPSRPAK